MNSQKILDFCAFLNAETTKDICFACHVSPDGDTMGSAFALMSLCQKRGRRAFVFVPDVPPQNLSFLTEEFDNTPFEPEVVVAVDVSTPERLGRDFPYKDRVRAVIDHHKHNGFFDVISLVEEDVCATGLIVGEVFRALGVTPDEKEARALYTAVSTDTGRFCHSNTSPEAPAFAGELARLVPGENFGDLNRSLFVQKEASLLRLQGHLLTHADLWEEEGAVFFVLTQALRRRFGLSEDADTGALVDVLRSFAGYDLCILAKEQAEKGVYKLSVRSEGRYSAHRLCESFGGGGHEKAAGCTLSAKSPRALKKCLIARVRELFSE